MVLVLSDLANEYFQYYFPEFFQEFIYDCENLFSKNLMLEEYLKRCKDYLSNIFDPNMEKNFFINYCLIKGREIFEPEETIHITLYNSFLNCANIYHMLTSFYENQMSLDI